MRSSWPGADEGHPAAASQRRLSLVVNLIAMGIFTNISQQSSSTAALAIDRDGDEEVDAGPILAGATEQGMNA